MRTCQKVRAALKTEGLQNGDIESFPRAYVLTNPALVHGKSTAPCSLVPHLELIWAVHGAKG